MASVCRGNILDSIQAALDHTRSKNTSSEKALKIGNQKLLPPAMCWTATEHRLVFWWSSLWCLTSFWKAERLRWSSRRVPYRTHFGVPHDIEGIWPEQAITNLDSTARSCRELAANWGLCSTPLRWLGVGKGRQGATATTFLSLTRLCIERAHPVESRNYQL